MCDAYGSQGLGGVTHSNIYICNTYCSIQLRSSRVATFTIAHHSHVLFVHIVLRLLRIQTVPNNKQMGDDANQYELQRQQRIARNRARMAELQVRQLRQKCVL